MTVQIKEGSRVKGSMVYQEKTQRAYRKGEKALEHTHHTCLVVYSSTKWWQLTVFFFLM